LDILKEKESKTYAGADNLKEGHRFFAVLGGGKFLEGFEGIFRKGVPRFAYVIWLWMDAPKIFGGVVIWGSHIKRRGVLTLASPRDPRGRATPLCYFIFSVYVCFDFNEILVGHCQYTTQF